MSWYYRPEADGGEVGPVSEDEIISFFKSGELTRETRVRREKSSIWQMLDRTEIGDVLGIKVETNLNPDAVKVSKVKPLGWYPGFFIVSASIYVLLIAIYALPGLILGIQTLATGEFDQNNILLIIMNIPYRQYLTLLVFWMSVLGYSLTYHRAMANLHAQHSPVVTTRPFMVWLWFAVPIASFFKPYSALSEIWSGAYQTAGRDEPENSPLGIWWACWIVGIIGVRIIAIMSNTQIERVESLAWLFICEALVMVSMMASAFCLILITRRIAYLMGSSSVEEHAEVFS